MYSYLVGTTLTKYWYMAEGASSRTALCSSRGLTMPGYGSPKESELTTCEMLNLDTSTPPRSCSRKLEPTMKLCPGANRNVPPTLPTSRCPVISQPCWSNL